MKNQRAVMVAWMLASALAVPVFGGEVTLLPSQDNTLYEVPLQSPEGETPPSNGSGDYFFAGGTVMGEVRRGLLAFDVVGSLPAGSVVTAVTLTLQMSRSIAGPTDVTLHRVLTDWGEGASDAPGQEGGGAPAAPGDATWFHTFFPDSLWMSEGGDFSPTASASRSVAGEGSYSWGSTPGMVADVQAWLDDPSSNFGWLVMSDELVQPSAKRFNSRENGSGVPQLTVTFQAPVPTVPLWTLAWLALVLTGLAVRRLRRDRQEVSA